MDSFSTPSIVIASRDLIRISTTPVLDKRAESATRAGFKSPPASRSDVSPSGLSIGGCNQLRGARNCANDFCLQNELHIFMFPVMRCMLQDRLQVIGIGNSFGSHLAAGTLDSGKANHGLAGARAQN